MDRPASDYFKHIEARADERYNPDAIADDFAISMALECLCGGMMAHVPNDQSGSESTNDLARAVDIGCDLWYHVCDYVHNRYGLTMARTGYLIGLRAVVEGPDSDTNLREHYKLALEQLTLRVLEENVDELTKTGKVDQEIEKMLSNADSNALAEFFTAYRELGTFHRSENDYETEEQKELHRRMLAAYMIILQGSQKSESN